MGVLSSLIDANACNDMWYFSVASCREVIFGVTVAEEQFAFPHTLAYIYNDSFDIHSIATQVLQDFFLTARKTGGTGASAATK
jgi:hypothetical protein